MNDAPQKLEDELRNVIRALSNSTTVNVVTEVSLKIERGRLTLRF